MNVFCFSNKKFVLSLISNKTFDSRKIRLLENVIMTWKDQIQTAINYDREPPKTKHYPLPNVEIEFWTARAENLQGIQTQVCSKLILIIKMI